MIDEKRDAKQMAERIVHIEVPFGKPIEEVYTGVHDGPVLGSGISGIVRLVTHKATGLKYAVKCLDLGKMSTKKSVFFENFPPEALLENTTTNVGRS